MTCSVRRAVEEYELKSIQTFPGKCFLTAKRVVVSVKSLEENKASLITDVINNLIDNLPQDIFCTPFRNPPLRSLRAPKLTFLENFKKLTDRVSTVAIHHSSSQPDGEEGRSFTVAPHAIPQRLMQLLKSIVM